MVPLASIKLSAFLVNLLLLWLHGASGLHYGPNYWNGGEYDFIVVGAGTGGCAVAARLTESGRYSVLLIEAGGIPHPDLEIPALGNAYFADPYHYSLYPTTPQTTAGLAYNGTITYMHGRTLGGTSTVNGMMLNRGSPHDYNKWAELTGDQSWSYSNMLKYFRKYENYTGDYPSDQRGFNGPITVSRPKYAPGVTEWLAAGRELGYTIAEPNGPQIISFTQVDYAMDFGRRVSSYSGYIWPMLRADPQTSNVSSSSQSESNLQIMINSQVTQIIFEGHQAIGVRITRSSEDGSSSVIFAKAKKEIILAGGVIGSPLLLQKSGIGSRSLLLDAKIPLIKDLPVGQNFQDHVILMQAIILGDRFVVFDPAVHLNDDTFREYLRTGDGPYSSYGGMGGQAFLELPKLHNGQDTEREWANVHLINFNLVSNFTANVGGEVIDPSELAENEIPVTWWTALTRPKSRGTESLNPRNVDGPPIIDLNYLSHPDDIRSLVEGMKVSVKICEETRALQRIGCRISRNPLSSCSHIPFRSDAYWECYARWFGNSGSHAAGTCRMGTGSDAVVDTKLRVIGVSGLRVADASIMPVIVNTNPSAGIYAIAEKCVEMILNTWEH